MEINDLFISTVQIIVTAVLTAYTTAKVNEVKLGFILERVEKVEANIEKIRDKVDKNENKLIKVEEKLRSIASTAFAPD